LAVEEYLGFLHRLQHFWVQQLGIYIKFLVWIYPVLFLCVMSLVLFIKNKKKDYKRKNISALLIMLIIFYFQTFIPRAPICGHLLSCEGLEASDYAVGFRRPASTQNLTLE